MKGNNIVYNAPFSRNPLAVCQQNPVRKMCRYSVYFKTTDLGPTLRNKNNSSDTYMPMTERRVPEPASEGTIPTSKLLIPYRIFFIGHVVKI